MNRSATRPAPARSRRAEVTRARIVATAERLFAARGIHAVSLAQINATAGQRNRNAVQYHFGSKRKLLQAIIDKHASAITMRRSQLLDNIETSPTHSLEDVVSALVLPVAAKLDDPDGGEAYIHVSAQLAVTHTLDFQGIKHSGLRINREERFQNLLRAKLPTLQPVVFTLRQALMVSMLFHGLSDHARLRAESDSAGDTALVHTPLVVSHLIDSITTVLESPPSPRTRELLRDFERSRA